MCLDLDMIKFHKEENFNFYPNNKEVEKQLFEGKRKQHLKKMLQFKNTKNSLSCVNSWIDKT